MFSLLLYGTTANLCQNIRKLQTTLSLIFATFSRIQFNKSSVIRLDFLHVILNVLYSDRNECPAAYIQLKSFLYCLRNSN